MEKMIVTYLILISLLKLNISLENSFFNNEKYQLIESLGKGSFGTSYKVYNKDDNTNYVIKRMDITNVNQKNIEEAKKEVKALSQIESEYIVRYYDSYEDEIVLI